MKSSLVLLSGASMALAGPLVRREVDVVVDVVTDVITETDFYTVFATLPAPTTSVVPVTTSSTQVPVVTVTVGSTTPSSPAPKAQVAAATTSSSSTTPSAYTSSAASAATSPTDLPGIAVYHHNIHRSNSSASDLTYDDTYAGYAATLAARCVFEHDVTIGNPSEAYGQNIAMYAATDIDDLDETTFLAQSITNMWFNGEIELYPGPYGSNPDMTDFEAWGHYSQVVWKGTTIVGCAVQKCAAGTMESDMAAYFSVCNYYPAGNVDTEYADNVGTPLGGATVTA